MPTIALTDQQAQHLVAFLNRVDIKGGEAMAMAMLQQIISQATAPSRDGAKPTEDIPVEETSD